MSRFLQPHWRRRRRCFFSHASALLAFAGAASSLGCGEVVCPQSLTNVDGVCETVDRYVQEPESPNPERKPSDPKPANTDELCDGLDNDGDDAIDEDWPELGEPCGESQGECQQGEYVCADDGVGVVCEGAIGPTAEICDGKDNDCDGIDDNGPAEMCDEEDNDCDGLIDEGILAIKQELFDDHATVASVEGGFVVTRVIGDRLRVETYDTDGKRTGHHDDIDNPTSYNAFLESDVSGRRLLVALGQHQFHVLEAHVDSELIPIILGTQELHDDWNQGIDWGIYQPPYHPRVSAAPPRFLGHRDIVTFAVSPFADGNLLDLAMAPAPASGLPFHAYFDTVGPFVAWEQVDNVRAGWLLDDGALLVDIDVARGTKPALAAGPEGPAIAFLRGGDLLLSELVGVTLQCGADGFCNAEIPADPVEETVTTAMGLAFDEARDTWVIAASDQLLIVGRGEEGPILEQSLKSRVRDEQPTRVDVTVSGGTGAIVQTAEKGASVLTFMGCF